MGILMCNKHGETGIIPTVSKNLADSMAAGNARKEDVATIYLRVYDDGELLFDKLFFTHKAKDMHLLKDEYVIENDDDDALFSKQVHPALKGGGYCVKCFKEYMEQIGFNLDGLRAASGLTI